MPPLDDQTRTEFLAQLEELLEKLCAEIDRLRVEPEPARLGRESLDRIFRCVHSVKGVSASAGLNSISELAHETETLLDGARNKRVPNNDALVDALEDAADAISESLSAALSSKPTRTSLSLINRIRLLSTAARKDISNASLSADDLPATISAALNDREKRDLLDALAAGEHCYEINANFDLPTFEQDFQELRSFLIADGGIIATTPTTDVGNNKIGFHLLYAVDTGHAQLKERLLKTFPTLKIEEIVLTGLPDSNSDNDVQLPMPRLEPFVRVELGELDRLISASHEIFRETVAALDVVTNRVNAEARTELQNLDAQIRQSLIFLEERIVQLRMVPVGRMIQRAIRAGRVAARISHKQVEFSISNGGLLVDKSLCDVAADPLLHLVRNAVDHGIESPDERLRAGKPSSGQIHISAAAEEGGATFIISDDGRGIDVDAVTKAGTKLGLFDAKRAVTLDQSLRLIFRPGFTTAAATTSISGRGVGLDVVETTIEQAGGAVRVRTHPGKGSHFLVHLPATFGVMRSILVRSAGHYYCFDESQTVEHWQVDTDQVNDSAHGVTLLWKGQTLRLASLRRILNCPSNNIKDLETMDVLICKRSAPDRNNGTTGHIAVLVDAVVGTHDVLVRSLGRHSARWHGIAGASELREGNIALVLNLPVLLNSVTF